MSDDTTTIFRGQTWLSAAGSAWVVEQRRQRAAGFVENLLVSEKGARRWLMDSEVREQFTPAP